MDGVNFRRQQLEDRELAGIPIVLVTGQPRKEKEPRRLGISAYLKKPVAPYRPVEVVERGCAHAPQPQSASVG